jgi:uncharacterized protein
MGSGCLSSFQCTSANSDVHWRVHLPSGGIRFLDAMKGDTSMEWHNEAPKWEAHDKIITIQSAPKTDFWRLTHYGYTYDSGHFYYQRRADDFLAEVKFCGAYNALYDQAGLMARLDETNWIKCGIEFLDGVQQVSAVVTREFSDWSVGITLPQDRNALWLRLKRQGSTIEIQYALDGTNYQLLRLAYLPTSETLAIGPMCASPTGGGFSTVFENFKVQQI